MKERYGFLESPLASIISDPSSEKGRIGINQVSNVKTMKDVTKELFWEDSSPIGGRMGGLCTDRCPKCKIILKFRGKEETTSKFAHHRYELFCPKCSQITYIDEGKSSRYANVDRVLGKHAGEIGEEIAKKFLVDAGYEITSFGELASNVFSMDKSYERLIRRGSVELFLGDKHQDFIRLCKVWKKEHWAGLDWVGRKEGKIYLIEVKANRAVLKDSQKKTLLKGKELGFIPLVVRIKVKISAPQEVQWKFV